MALNQSLIAGVFLILFVMQPFTVQSILNERATNQISSFQRLLGLHKGQAMTHLHELKQYLNKFGYLTSHDANINNHGRYVFDDKLEAAVKSYQRLNHLEVTGVLDQNTIDDMKVPRCGVPDLINESQQPKWPASKTHLTYTFYSTAEANVGPQALRSVCARAFKKWASILPFTFEEATEGTRADIEIGFHRGFHGDSCPFDGLGKISAHAYLTPENTGHLHFNADENWSSNSQVSKNEMDLETVALHEIGHLLGLQHSFNQNAVMNSHFKLGATKRELHIDDVKAVVDLYYANKH